jgi:methionyl-tRNA formyltransferase
MRGRRVRKNLCLHGILEPQRVPWRDSTFQQFQDLLDNLWAGSASEPTPWQVLTRLVANGNVKYMRIVFMGAPEFAVPTLREIVSDGHAVAAIYTRSPKPGGRRGLEVKKTPVHEAAELLRIPVFTPTTLKGEDARDVFRSHAADVAVVVAYGLLLPMAILEAPRRGCLNLHASLLPRWRGAAPIQRAIMAGDTETGVDLMRMEEGLDTGPVALREVAGIQPKDTAGVVARRLAEVAAKLMVRGLNAMERGSLAFREQSSFGVCYARKIGKGEAEIDWTRGAVEICNHIHGLSPTPGSFSNLSIGNRLERVKILKAEATRACGAPGTILDDQMTVACGNGAIRIIEGQRAGRAAMPGPNIVRGEQALLGATFMRARKSSSLLQAQF